MSIRRKLKTFYRKTLIEIANSKVGDSVCSFLNSSAAIMLAGTGKKRRSKISECLMVSSLIASTNNIDNGNSVIKNNVAISTKSEKVIVRVVHCNPSTITAIETFCEAFKEDRNKYDLKIILIHDSGASYALVDQMKKKGFSYIFDNEYDITVDRPDIMIFYQLEWNYSKELFSANEYSKMVVLVPLTLTTIWYGESSIRRCNLDKFKPDIIFATDLTIGKIPKSSKYKLIRMIPPQVDSVYSVCRELSQKKEYPKNWDKLKGKKVILYMTDHGLQQYSVCDEVSFDLYIGTLIKYAKEHEDMGLIIRPHFSLIRELFAWYWSLDDYRSFVEFCDKSPNIIWDESKDFMTALNLCDAVISDINTSVTYYSLASMKPIAISMRYDMPVEINNEELMDNLYTLHSKEECIKFIDMIKYNKDPMRNKRQKLFNRLMIPFDGKNGERIKEAIEKEYQAKHHRKLTSEGRKIISANVKLLSEK